MLPDSRLLHDRRTFLAHAAGAGLTLAGWASSRASETPKKRMKVAAIFTEFTPRSHAHVILENFLEPYYFNGKETDSGCDVVSFFRDQKPNRDMADAVAKAYGIGIYPTIAEALCLGGKDLAVDAVLSIGEFGRYPINKKGQHEYPRKRFFDEIVAVFRKSGRAVPLFNDKHLSFRWDWAREMYDTAKSMAMPFMAGSSVPLAQRIPPLEIPQGSKIVEAVSTHGGGLDSYDFHAMEVLQSIVEARAGGETGVKSVQYLEGEALWRAAREGLWSPDLLQAAWDSEPDGPSKKVTLQQLYASQPWGLLVRYRDGLKGMAIRMAGGGGTRWNFACRLADQKEPLATSFYVGPWRNRNLFKALSHAIQIFFREGKAPYPVERTLLTTGMVEAGVESHFRKDAVYETPHLDFAYTAPDWSRCREMGASWKIVGEDVKEHEGIDHLGKPAKK